jgi:hypothetical protein
VNALTRIGATAVVGAAVTIGTAGIANAATSPSGAALARIQVAANTQIAGRLTALDAAIPAVDGNAVITSADKTTLTATLTADVSGLTALRQTIDADTTAQQASIDERTIFTTYRVYALALPQVRYAAAGDGIAGDVLPALTNAQHALETLLAGPDSAKNTAAVQASMNDLEVQLSTAATKSTGLAATVLAFTPAAYDANHALLSPSRQNLAGARAAIASAQADIASVRDALA